MSDKKPKPKKRRKPRARRSAQAYQAINEYAKWCNANRPEIGRITVALTERYTRHVLGLRQRDALVWRGLVLRCIGSPAVRERAIRV